MINDYYWELKTPETFIVDGVELAWIPGYEHVYACSKDGKIYSEKVDRRNHGTHWLKGKQPKSQCYYIKFSAKEILVHRAVAETWLINDDPENKIVVDHINQIPTDNRVENLRWATISENCSNKQLKPYDQLSESGKKLRDKDYKRKPMTDEQRERKYIKNKEYYENNKEHLEEKRREKCSKYVNPIKTNLGKKVKQLSTGKIFDSAVAASRYYNKRDTWCDYQMRKNNPDFIYIEIE